MITAITTDAVAACRAQRVSKPPSPSLFALNKPNQPTSSSSSPPPPPPQSEVHSPLTGPKLLVSILFPFHISNVMRSVWSSVWSLYVVIGHFPSLFRQGVGSLIDVIGSPRSDLTVTRQDALTAPTEARTEAGKSKESLKQMKWRMKPQTIKLK
jgi:hypothetical protein